MNNRMNELSFKAAACEPFLFSPLGKLAGRAIYFACVNFFFFSLFFYYEHSYLSIYWTDFHEIVRYSFVWHAGVLKRIVISQF